MRSGEQKAALEAADLCQLLRVGCAAADPPGLFLDSGGAEQQKATGQAPRQVAGGSDGAAVKYAR